MGPSRFFAVTVWAVNARSRTHEFAAFLSRLRLAFSLLNRRLMPTHRGRVLRGMLATGLVTGLISSSTFAFADDDPPPPLPSSPAPAAGPTETAAPPQAAAAPIAKEAPAPPEPTVFNYTVPMMATDLAFMGLFAGSWTLGHGGSISPGTALGGSLGAWGGYVASGAVYHQIFDVRKKTLLSIVVRSLAPLTFGAAVAAGVHDGESKKCKKAGTPEDQCDHDGTQTGMMIGALIGMLGATVAEATILVPDGRKPLPPDPPKSAFSIAPSVAMQTNGGQVGVGGTF
jgi:hypothetical protein